MWCEIIIPSQGSKILVGVFYRSPSSDAVYLSELQKSLSLIDRSGTNLPLLLLGDFNLPNITWGEVPKCYDALSAVFCDVVDDYFLQQMVFEPTRTLIFAKALEIRIIPRSNLTGKLKWVDLNRLLGLFTTFAQHIGKVSGRISLSSMGYDLFNELCG